MPPSAALARFGVAASAVDALLVLEGNYVDPPPTADEHVVRGLRGGAGVIMVAAFEQFLRECIPERLGSLNGGTPSVNFDDLPKNLRVNAIFGHLQRALDGPKFEHSERVSRIAAIRAASAAIAGKVLVASALAPERSPLSDNIVAACDAFGLKRIFIRIDGPFRAAWGKPESTTFIRDKLDEIVRRRHRLAHTADVLNVARRDVRDGLPFLRTLAGALDDEFENHVSWIRANPGKERP